MKRLFFVVLFLAAELHSQNIATNTGRSIPGVDPLPVATAEEKKSTPNSAGQDNYPGNQQQVQYGDFPKIRNLRVAADPRFPHSAIITWEVHPTNTTPIYVVRYSSPITTREILLNSYNLTFPPLQPNTTSFIDMDIPEGVYYYAVVTAFEVSREGVLILKPGVNYTVLPFIVYRGSAQTVPHADQKQNVLPAEMEVSDLVAINSEKGVILNWKPVELPNVKYKIYRGFEPLDSLERFRFASYLGETFHPFFIDERPLDEGVYYGVSIFDDATKTEYKQLKFRKSYIYHAYKKPSVEVQYLEFLPESIISYQVDKNTIQLYWIDAGSGVLHYRIYRSQIPVQNQAALENAKFLGIAESGKIGFLDKNLLPGSYYYAVLPVLTNRNELRVFVPNRTFTTYAIYIHGDRNQYEFKVENDTGKEIPAYQPESPQSYELHKSTTGITYIRFQKEGEDSIRITWSFQEAVLDEQLIFYRSDQMLPLYDDTKTKGRYIGNTPLVAGVFIDQGLADGEYYYGIAELDVKKNRIVAYHYTNKPIKISRNREESRESQVLPAITGSESRFHEEIPERNSGKEELQEDSKLEQASIYPDPDADLDRILRNIWVWIFQTKEYKKAEIELQKLMQNDRWNRNQRGKIKFYYGLLLFRLNKRDEARKIFLDEEVQSFDAERSNFWYRRTLTQ